MDQFPAHWGVTFTPTQHSKPEGPTDPANVKLPSNFVVAITGAGKGLGYHIAVSFAKAGAKGIVVSSRTQSDLDKLATEIKSINPAIELLAQTCDTQKDEQVKALAEATQFKFGRLDVCVANAGIASNYITKDGKQYMATGLLGDPDFSRVMDTNVMGTYRTATHFLPLLQQTKDGLQAFVVISSVASHMTKSDFITVAYNLSKCTLNRMVEQVHGDHHHTDGVQAFAVHPGSVLTTATEGHHNTQLGDLWNSVLIDDVALCGGFLTWLTAERKPWLSGRYLSANWDVNELTKKRDEIVEKDLLTFKMTV